MSNAWKRRKKSMYPMLQTSVRRSFEMPFGAHVRKDGVRFNIWAPTAQTIELVLYGKNGAQRVPLECGKNGWFTIFRSDAGVGTRYHYLVNNELRVPDPASRFQPEDVHGPSEVVDPEGYAWGDEHWLGKPWVETVLYELHVGTFTPAGTFKSAIDKLDYLKDLGVTAIELMPLSDFPGKCNWGYDGVLPFAPDSRYGTPNDLKHLVDQCHQRGIMVFLDVVYNHFGPEGNYLHAYADRFFNAQHETPWGAGINFDASGNEVVRDYFISNALYWLTEYNFDGLRFDAVHAIKDDSKKLFLEELAERVRAGIGSNRHIHLVVENDDNRAALLRRDTSGGTALFTAQWNDDYHHCMHVLLTKDSSGYYFDYTAAGSQRRTVEHVVRLLTEGFAYQGEGSPYRDGLRRGEKSSDLPPAAFVNFLQNHDQIGNRAFGERMAALSPHRAVNAGLALLLLAPQIPMLYMGEEWASKQPFLFFCDLGADLAPLVTRGRREEFARFEQFSDPQVREQIPDPSAERTYKDSRLDWSEKDAAENAQTLALTTRLLKMRNDYVTPLLTQRGLPWTNGSQIFSDSSFAVHWQIGSSRLTCFANLGESEVTFDRDNLPDTEPLFALGDLDLGSSTAGAWTVAWWLENAK